MPPLKIIVVGAGIAGLAAATAFRQRGAAVIVVEQAPALGAIGAGIQVTPNGLRVLDALGLGAQARARSLRAEAVEAMDALNDREKHILTERRLTDEPKTLEELSQVYDVSRERIRQIEVRAFEKLQKALMSLAGERRLLAVG